MEFLTEESLYSKTPQELTSILYQALLERMNQAKETIQTREYDKANKHLQKCNDIIYRLGAGLNYEAGIIADQLEAIYQYLAQQTIKANLKKDTKIIDEMIVIVQRISEAWQLSLERKTEEPSLNRLGKALAYEASYSSGSLDIKE